jgi:hypothetical protein
VTARRSWTLVCDHAGGAGCHPHDAQTFTIDADHCTKTRIAAGAQGWTSGVLKRPHGGPARTFDYCRACSEKIMRRRIVGKDST